MSDADPRRFEMTIDGARSRLSLEELEALVGDPALIEQPAALAPAALRNSIMLALLGHARGQQELAIARSAESPATEIPTVEQILAAMKEIEDEC